jgi:hypothetical protein
VYWDIREFLVGPLKISVSLPIHGTFISDRGWRCDCFVLAHFNRQFLPKVPTMTPNKMLDDEELQSPLLDGTPEVVETSLKRATNWRIRAPLVSLVVVVALSLAVFGISCCSKNHSMLGHHHAYHGHVFYQATLKPNNQIEYAREFTAPCDHGILVFNIGPAADYLPYQYDVYQDAYVFSNNKKLCWAYPTYRGIQKGPFPWWVQGDPTSFDVSTGLTPIRISHRVVRPAHSKNFTAHKGGDYLIMAHHKFYTPAFYENLKHTVNSGTDEDLDMGFEQLLIAMTDDDGTLPVSGEFQLDAQD